jgi:hypothetical protein
VELETVVIDCGGNLDINLTKPKPKIIIDGNLVLRNISILCFVAEFSASVVVVENITAKYDLLVDVQNLDTNILYIQGS